MRNKLFVDGTDLSTFGVYISGQGTFASPERENTFYDVPGRDGSVLGATTKLRNIQVTYPAFIYTNFDQNMRDLRSFLLSRKGYFRIEDTYDTTHFRMGVMGAPIDPDVTPTNDAGQFNIVFNCMPQRWLKSGENVITITSTSRQTIANNTLFTAKPIIRAYGTGEYYVIQTAGVYVRIISDLDTTVYPYVELDCDTMQAYYEGTNLNYYVGIREYSGSYDLWGRDAPVFLPGNNYVKMGSGFTKLEITPRWWEV